MSTIGKMSAPRSSSWHPQARESFAQLFGFCIQECRKESGLSVAEAARLSGMKASEWAAVEEGTVLPQYVNQLRAMAGAMRINFEKLANLVVLCRAAWEL